MCYYHALLLMRLQYLAMTARTSEEALTRLGGPAPSLILTAVSSAANNGMDFIKTLKDCERTRAIPLIALVDERDEKLVSSCRESGCLACLIQPADPHLLFQTVQSITETTPRAHIRINLALKAVLEGCGTFSKTEQVAYTSTISEGGFSVRTHATPPRHSLTPVRISIKDREIRARAEVLYHTTSDPQDVPGARHGPEVHRYRRRGPPLPAGLHQGPAGPRYFPPVPHVIVVRQIEYSSKFRVQSSEKRKNRIQFKVQKKRYYVQSAC